MGLHGSDHLRVPRVVRAAFAAVAVCGLCSGVHAAQKAKPAKVKESRRAETRDIKAMEEQWRNAIVSGDAATMDKLLADDFLAISARGTLLDKQQYLNRLSTHATRLSSVDLVDVKIRVQPHSAVSVSQARISGMLEGRPIEGTFRYTKVYTRAPGGAWHMTNFEATRVSHAAADEQDQGMPTGEHAAAPTSDH